MTHQAAEHSKRTGANPHEGRRTRGHRLAAAGWVALSLAAGGIGAIASRRAAEQYASLVQPSWAPPSWLFAPVWNTLYIMMGIAAYLVWRERPEPASAAHAHRRIGLTLFVVQLAFNALWSWIFFAWRQGALAFAEIIVLLVAIALTAASFARVRAAAGWLLVPYLAWVTYATALTWAIWQANPGQL